MKFLKYLVLTLGWIVALTAMILVGSAVDGHGTLKQIAILSFIAIVVMSVVVIAEKIEGKER